MQNFTSSPMEPAWHAALRRLRQPEISPEQKLEDFALMKAFFDGMTTADVMRDLSRDFLPTYLNLLWLNDWFGDAPAKRDLAARCVKSKIMNEAEFLFRLSQLRRSSEVLAPGWLEGWNGALLRDLLGAGKGLIIATTKTGPYRNIPLEFALFGLPIFIAVNASSFPVWKSAVEGMKARVDPDLVLMANAEERSGIIAMMRALRSGRIVIIYFEGSTGTDGPWGRGSKSIVQYFGKTLLVRNGVARLSSDAPLLPMTTVKSADGRPTVMYGQPLMPGRKDGDEESGLQRVMQHLFSFAQDVIGNHPDQSETFPALHRLRAPEKESPVRPQPVDASEVTHHLEVGGRIRLDAGRCVLVPSDGGLYCIDSRTLQGVLLPRSIAGFLEGMESPAAYLDQTRFGRGVAPETRNQGIRSIAELVSRGLMLMSTD
jgi:lauroyl/myristoyl acyltransferase